MDFFLFLFTICQPTSCFKLLYFLLAGGDSPYNIQRCCLAVNCRRCCKLAEWWENVWDFFFLLWIVAQGFYKRWDGQTHLKHSLLASCKLMFKLSLFNSLNGPLFRCVLCGRATHRIVPLFPGSCVPLCIQCFFFFFACLSLCAMTEPSLESCQCAEDQTVCCPLLCLWWEPLLWEKLFRE